MPQAIPYIMSWVAGKLVAYGVAVKVAVAIGYAVAYAAVLAAAYGVSRMLAPKGPDLAGQLDTPNSPMPSKKMVFGRTRVGGDIIYHAASPVEGGGEKNQLLHIVIEIAGHHIDAIEDIYLNDGLLGISTDTTQFTKRGLWPNANATDANGVPRYVANSPRWREIVGFKLYRQGDNGIADADLIAATRRNVSGLWKTTHCNKTSAYVYIRCAFEPEEFSGFPRFSFLVKGNNEIYDPRTDEFKYSDNPALCLAWYLTQPRDRGGFGATFFEIDTARLIDSANICDEMVTVTGDGGQQKRYFLAGQLSTDMEPQQILTSLTQPMAGWYEEIAGKHAIYAGKSAPVALTITESEFRGGESVQLTRGQRDVYNSLRPVARVANNNYMPTTLPSVELVNSREGDVVSSVIQVPAHGFVNGGRVKALWWTGSTIDNSQLPSPLIGDRYYYVVNATTDTFRIANARNAAPLTIANKAGVIWEYDILLSQDTERIFADVGYDLVADETLARRLAQIQLRELRQEITATLPLKLGTPYAPCLDLSVGDNLRWIDAHKSFWEPVGASYSAQYDEGTNTFLLDGEQENDAIVLTDTAGAELPANVPLYVVNRNTTDMTYQLSRWRGGKPVEPATIPATVIAQAVRGKLFRVTTATPTFADGICGIDVTVVETLPDMFDWTAQWEPVPEQAAGITTIPVSDVETPALNEPQSGTDQLIKQADGTIVTRVRLSWSAPTSAYVANGGRVEIEYKISAASDWVAYGTVAGASREVFILGLQDGGNYDFRIRYRNSFAARGDWAERLNHTVIGKTAPPEPVTALTATTNLAARINLTWVRPADVDALTVRIERAVGFDIIGLYGAYSVIATIPITQQSYSDISAVGRDMPRLVAGPGLNNFRTCKYRLTVIDTTGNESTQVEVIGRLDTTVGKIAATFTDLGNKQVRVTWVDNAIYDRVAIGFDVGVENIYVEVPARNETYTAQLGPGFVMPRDFWLIPAVQNASGTWYQYAALPPVTTLNI